MFAFRYNFNDILNSDSEDEFVDSDKPVINRISDEQSKTTKKFSTLTSSPTLRSPENTPFPQSAPLQDATNNLMGVPDLKLPGDTHSGDDTDSSQLEEEENIQSMMTALQLTSKLPKFNNSQPQLVVYHHEQNALLPENSQLVQTPNSSTKQDTVPAKSIISELIASVSASFEQLETTNQREVNKVLAEKKAKEEERLRRIEEKRLRKEAEAKRIREEEERNKKQKEAQIKAAEERARQEKLKQEEAQRKKEAADKLAKEKEAAAKAKEEEIAASRGKYTTNFPSIEKKFLHYKQEIATIKRDIVEPVKKLDKEQKNMLARHKRKINPKFGQLTNSNQQLRSVATELQNLIQQTSAQPLMYKWILNFTAKAIVHQAENETRVKPESALPLAKLALYLMQTIPDLRELLMARFVKKCPFVIGFTCAIDTEQGRINMGWKRNSDEKWELSTSYDERIGGMMTLFAVITRLDTMVPDQPNPWSFEHSWMMVARVANTPLNLLTNVHFVALGAWWDATARQFLQKYGDQGAKLLRLVGDQLTSAVAEHKYVGAARLRILMEDWVSNNNISSFPEMDP